MILEPVDEEPVKVPVEKPMSAQQKYYWKNSEKVKGYAGSYYQQNAERIKARRNERYRLAKEAKNI
jgi:hypothetical protein